MSTGAECRIYEKEPRQWYYDLQRWPYGDWPEYDTFGPFGTYHNAERHLRDYQANPGGWSIDALPGCEHDLAHPLTEWERGKSDKTHVCERCAAWFRPED